MKTETISYMETENAIIDKNYYANSKFLLEAYQGECILQAEIIHQKIQRLKETISAKKLDPTMELSQILEVNKLE